MNDQSRVRNRRVWAHSYLVIATMRIGCVALSLGCMVQAQPLLINSGGWDSVSVAVHDGYVYWTGRYLYRAELHQRPFVTQVIDNKQNWGNVPIAVSDGYVYWTKDNDLYRARLGATALEATETVNHGGWDGTPFTVSDGFVYWIRNDNLYRSDVDLRPILTDVFDRGGWSGTRLSVSAGHIYWVNNADLRRARLDKLRESRIVSRGDWSTRLFTVHGGYVYWTSENNLWRQAVEELLSVPGMVGHSRMPVVRIEQPAARDAIKMSFTLEAPAQVTLEVASSEGRVISRLIDERLVGAVDNVWWETDGLPNGPYFYRLRIGERVTGGLIVIAR